jgi:H+-translocating NAD(P) transhydrogenase subunit alpha
MKVGIPKEIYPHEARVAATPDTVEKMAKLGLELMVEAGAGEASTFADAAYIEAGARVVGGKALYAEADIVLKVRQPIARPDGTHEADLLKPGAVLISFIWPAQNKALVDRLAARKVTVFAMDAVPRITRAQKLDALSAMANIAGYRAVVEAAHHFGRFFSGQVTAAGRVKPAQVLILGAGVAGLAAVAAAKGLGAVVKAFDTRPVVREQVESLGAQFIEFKFEESGEGAGGYAKQMSDAYLAAEQALIAKHAQASDIIISTALIPGKPAPVLITPGAVTAMAQGSVIVDMAAEQGGNCPLTERDKVVEKSGVTIIGLTDLPSRMARQSSELYATTVLNLLKEMFTAEKGLAIDLKDEIQRGAVVLKDGELLWPAPAPAAPPTPAAAPKPKAAPGGHGANHGAAGANGQQKKSSSANVVAALAAILLGAAAIFGPPEFIQHLTVFLLACVVGWHVIWNVTPALHTPLMSVTNAISGIIVIGGMLALYGGGSGALALGGVAVLLAAINVAGGFLVTQRMLKMFRK